MRFEMIQLGKVCNLIKGVTFSKKETLNEFVEGYLPVIRAGNIQKQLILNQDLVFVSEKKIKPEQLIRENDIIMCTSSGSIKLVGKCAYSYEDWQGSFGAFNICIRPSQKVDPRYIFHYLNSSTFKNWAQLSVGANIKNIRSSELTKLQIPLPPLPEQKRIAKILDKADALRQKNQNIIDQYNQLAQSIFLDMFGDPVLNSKGWEKIELKKVTTKIGSGATPKGGKEAYKSSGISLIRSLNVHDCKFLMKDLAFIDDKQAEKLKNVIVEPNDVLFNITGASVCRSVVVPNDILPARVNQHVAILRVNDKKLNSIFLNYMLISKNFKQMLMKIATNGGATREAITKDQLNNILITLPPIHLQNQFAQKIQNIEKQKELAQQALQQSEDLFQALLQKAFKGEL